MPDATFKCPFCGAARYERFGRSSGIVLWIAGAAVLSTMVALIGVFYLSRNANPPSSSLSCSSSEPNDIEVHLESTGITVNLTQPGAAPLVGALGVLVALEDERNNDVCASGTVTVALHDYVEIGPDPGSLILNYGYGSHSQPMFSETWTVDARDFSIWKLKNEATEAKTEQRLMWFSGRIPYSKFFRPGTEVGQVEVMFRLKNGVALKGKSRYFQIYQEVGDSVLKLIEKAKKG